MVRAFASLIVVLILAGAALGVNGFLGTEPGQRLASRCSGGAEGGQSCQTGRSGYGIDDLALNEPGSSERKARKRSLTSAKKAPADAPAHDDASQMAAADTAATAPEPARSKPIVAASPGSVATATEDAAAKPVGAAKPVEAPVTARETTAWKDPVAPPAPVADAKSSTPEKPSLPYQSPRTATAEPSRPEVGPRPPLEPTAQARPEAPARATEPKPEPRSEPRIRTAEPKAPLPPRNVAETGRTRQPVAREAERADKPEKASTPRIAEAPKARRRVVTRARTPHEPAAEVVASLAPPPAKPLEVAPARRPDLGTESSPPRRVSLAPRRILRQAPVARAPSDDTVRVGMANAAPLPPRPIPDRAGGSTAFPSDFQSALRHYNARYSMYAVRRALPWSGDDD